MNQEYYDIISRLGPPLWWDEHSVPRYDPFDPGLCNNIYASEACLLEIGCQSCDERFLVAMSWSIYDEMLHGLHALSLKIERGLIHWGDPPYHYDLAGSTENCIDLRVVEFWKRDRGDWYRVPELEIELEDEDD